MCKHVAAVLDGVGSRHDESPELLFILRGVDHEELISAPIDSATSEGTGGRRRIADDKLGDVFGIELAPPPAPGKTQSGARRKKSSTTASGRGITGKRVSNLRIKFGMSRADFAALLGVSVTTVANWEKNPGLLGLRLQSQEAFDAVKKLTKKEAIAKVKADRKKR